MVSFVASRYDERACKALYVLDQLGYRTKIIDPDQGEQAEATDVAFFTGPTTNGHSHYVAMPPGSLKGNAPPWAQKALIPIILKPHPGFRSGGHARLFDDDNFKRAIQWVARCCVRWDYLNVPPWLPVLPQNRERRDAMNTWCAKVSSVAGRNPLARALLNHRLIEPHHYAQSLPSDGCQISTIFCPHYLSHGVLGGVETVDEAKVLKSASLLNEIAQHAGGEFTEMHVYMPTKKTSHGPWRYTWYPCMWDDPQLPHKVAAGEMALRKAVDILERASGITMHVHCYSELGDLEQTVQAHPLITNEMVNEHALSLQRGEADTIFPRYKAENIKTWVRYCAALYFLAVESLTTIIALENSKRWFNRLWPLATQINPSLNIWWPPPTHRQGWDG